MARDSYGRGSHTKLPDGRWLLRIYAGKDPITGKALQPELRFKGSETAALKRLAKMTADLESGKLDPTTATVAQVLAEWLAFRKAELKASTWREHERTVNKDIVPALGKVPAAKLTGHQVDRWMAAMLDNGLAPATVRRRFSVLRAALAQARKWQWIVSNPCDDATQPKAGQQAVLSVPTPAELAGFREKAIGWETPEGDLLAFAIGLAALTGCRRGELCALRWADLDLKAEEVAVYRSRTVIKKVATEVDVKTHQGRTLGLDPTAVGTLRARQKAQKGLARAAEAELVENPYLLSLRADGAEPVVPDWLTYRFGVLTSGKFRWHDLRHWAGTFMTDAGVAQVTVMKRLGHKSARTTEMYTHPVEGRDREAAVALGKLLG
jgi:integrase